MSFFNFHTHISHTQSIVNHLAQELFIAQEHTHYSVGIHPWDVHLLNLPFILESLKEKAGKKQIVALGECGYDVHAQADKELQLQIFEQHIVLAERHRKPLILHWVKGWDMLEKRLKMGIRVPVAVHGFSAKKEVAYLLLKNHVFLSFGAILFRKDASVQQYFRTLPLSQIFLETDQDSTLSIEEVYAQAARLLSMDITDLQTQISTNLKYFFSQQASVFRL